MKIFNRLILFIITLVFMFAVISLGLYSFGLTGINFIPELIESIYNRWEFGILFGLAFIGGAWVIYPFIYREQEEVKTTPIHASELGDVDITLGALENMVRGIAKQQESIEEITTDLQLDQDGIRIYMTGKVHPNSVIPEMADELQRIVKSYLEDTTGVKITEIKILIKDIYEDKSLEVE
ncbi:MAG: alkaline shock response membrane anchor protein AmaP [Bacillota bacterium]